jgi:hypothetical protein
LLERGRERSACSISVYELVDNAETVSIESTPGRVAVPKRGSTICESIHVDMHMQFN